MLSGLLTYSGPQCRALRPRREWRGAEPCRNAFWAGHLPNKPMRVVRRREKSQAWRNGVCQWMLRACSAQKVSGSRNARRMNSRDEFGLLIRGDKRQLNRWPADSQPSRWFRGQAWSNGPRRRTSVRKNTRPGIPASLCQTSAAPDRRLQGPFRGGVFPEVLMGIYLHPFAATSLT
jgi:hypothetical protein